jgi:hypothetical protein
VLRNATAFDRAPDQVEQAEPAPRKLLALNIFEFLSREIPPREMLLAHRYRHCARRRFCGWLPAVEGASPTAGALSRRRNAGGCHAGADRGCRSRQLNRTADAGSPEDYHAGPATRRYAEPGER